MHLPIYTPHPKSTTDFVKFWGGQYSYEGEPVYTENIGKPLTKERLRALFLWKNGMRLSRPKTASVERRYVGRLAELQKLPASTDPADFLQRFAGGGAIWGIFLLHCWSPDRYPIYDQHGHRAMTFIAEQPREEITDWTDKKKIASYLSRYLVFHCSSQGHDLRMVDRALWAFGKFIQTAKFPDVLSKGYGLNKQEGKGGGL